MYRITICASLLVAATSAHAQTVAWPSQYAASMARMHAGETPLANGSSAIAPRADVVGEDVTYGNAANGTPLRGYLAHPAEPGSHPLPGIIAIHEWWGLNDNIRAAARRLAGEGYTVLAVDLYGGNTATAADSARSLMTLVMQTPEPAAANLKAANKYLRSVRHAPRVGTVGWCFGGGWSIRDALLDAAHVDAAVAYYGPPDLDRTQLVALRAPFLGLYGGADDGISVVEVREFQAALDSLGKTATFKIYEGAKHAFANPSGPAYDAAAADDAWQRTTAFLAQYLKG
jgi:carboxymethylenebutenolidase